MAVIPHATAINETDAFGPDNQVEGSGSGQGTGHLLMFAQQAFRIPALVTCPAVCLDKADCQLLGKLDLALHATDA